MCLEVYGEDTRHDMCVLKTTIGSACEPTEPKVSQFVGQSKV